MVLLPHPGGADALALPAKHTCLAAKALSSHRYTWGCSSSELSFVGRDTECHCPSAMGWAASRQPTDFRFIPAWPPQTTSSVDGNVAQTEVPSASWPSLPVTPELPGPVATLCLLRLHPWCVLWPRHTAGAAGHFGLLGQQHLHSFPRDILGACGLDGVADRWRGAKLSLPFLTLSLLFQQTFLAGKKQTLCFWKGPDLPFLADRVPLT